MLLGSALNEPLKAEKRILLKFVCLPFVPFNLLICSYLDAILRSLNFYDYDLLMCFGVVIVCKFFILTPG